MGRKLHGKNYQGGAFYRQDDRSGFTVRAGHTKQEWTGLIVDSKLFEMRQPQDLVKGVVDDQTVPQARPIGNTIFTGPLYFSIQDPGCAVGDTFIPLQYIAGITDGDSVGIMLDTQAWFYTTVSGSPISTGINISTPLPYPAASGNLVVDISS